jgi:MoaA/NifB/PqqE/SkfB family radical SAM enzyme
MKLEDIGFYTLADKRARNCSATSRLWRCELLLTSRCNFQCPYCRKMDGKDITIKEAIHILDLWADDGLKNVRFSGGEPTLWGNLLSLVQYTKACGIERIALSTNGSAPPFLYYQLVNAGVNDFSFSLDACCSSTANLMSGGMADFNLITHNIKEISKLTYATIGIVVTNQNIKEVEKIISMASEWGIADIRIISAAQNNSIPIHLNIKANGFPILSYRLNNMKQGKPMRGLTVNDNNRCPLVLDDMAVWDGNHYPCIIYLREKGLPIGKIGPNMRRDRSAWAINHDTYQDNICRNNCLDVCVAYNNKVKETTYDHKPR